MDDAKWYVVHTYSGYENTVKATIEKHVDNRGLQNLIHEISIPMNKTTSVSEDEEKVVESKLFPGYILAKMVMTDESWHVVRSIRGVTGFLGEGNTPLPLTDAEVARMGVVKEEIIVNYAVGDGVTILAGALESFTGIVEEIDLEQKVVRVTVSMFGRETPVELELNQVEPVHA